MVAKLLANKALFTALAIALLILPGIVSARDVVSNSADWRDVYSTILYGNLAGASPHFLTGTAHGPILLFEIPKSSERVEIITSADKPFYVGYESLMRSKGYNNTDETILESANLELATRLPEINKFIVLDDAYGYNALAVAPYAAKAKHYVLFANSRNIDDITDFLSTKQVGQILIYGHVDREVRAALSQYNPEIIDSETGSRFENNMRIVEKYSEVGSIKQVILSNGEFIETSMMTGNEPVLFIGKNNVPQEVKDFIKQKGVEIGVLIGNELIGTATDIRRQLGISVFVKFARGSRVPGGTISPVEDLDRFPMPSYRLSISITGISYNRATGQLEVTYKNNANIATYLRTTITVKKSDGETILVTGDEDTIFLDGEETKTVVYQLEGLELTDNELEQLSAEIYTIYGESKQSLENVLRGTFKIEIISIQDDADISIKDLVYDKTKGKFYVTIENVGPVDAYVSAELIDLWVNRAYVTVSSDDVIKIEKGKSKEIPISIRLEEEDLESDRNSVITVRGIFGERRNALIRIKTAEFELKIKSSIAYQYVLILVAIGIIIWLILAFRKKKKCQRCRTANDSDAKVCKKCGHDLR